MRLIEDVGLGLSDMCVLVNAEMTPAVDVVIVDYDDDDPGMTHTSPKQGSWYKCRRRVFPLTPLSKEFEFVQAAARCAILFEAAAFCQNYGK